MALGIKYKNLPKNFLRNKYSDKSIKLRLHLHMSHPVYAKYIKRILSSVF